MEGRSTDLYVELTDLEAADYESGRVANVLARRGATRASWWANAHPHRADLPRAIDEFPMLGLYEVGGEFDPPADEDGVRGFLFRRTGRPGQGCLSGETTNGVLLVLISPRHPQGARALRDWADFVHIRHIAAAGVPGYRMITPFESADHGDPRYLHLYEMVTADPEATFRTMTPLVASRLGGEGSPAYRQWAVHPELRIVYVNTFRLLGRHS